MGLKRSVTRLVSPVSVPESHQAEPFGERMHVWWQTRAERPQCCVSQIWENPQELLQHKRALILRSCTNTTARLNGGMGGKRKPSDECCRHGNVLRIPRQRRRTFLILILWQQRRPQACGFGLPAGCLQHVCSADLWAAARMMSQSKQMSQSVRFESPPQVSHDRLKHAHESELMNRWTTLPKINTTMLEEVRGHHVCCKHQHAPRPAASTAAQIAFVLHG